MQLKQPLQTIKRNLKHTLGAVFAILSLASASALAQTDALNYQFDIQGVDKKQKANVQSFLGDPSKKKWTPNSIVRFHQKIPEVLQQSLQALGYYRSTSEIELTSENDRYVSHIRIEPGEPTRYRRVDVTLDGDISADQEFLEDFKRWRLKDNDIVHHGDYEAFKTRMVKNAYDRGYLDARWLKTLVVVGASQQFADADLQFSSGVRYRIAAVNFQQGALADAVLRRFIPFTEGVYFDSALVIKLQDELLRSDYFQSVRIEKENIDASAGTLVLQVNYQLRPKHKYLFGIGIATDIGVKVNAAYENRLVNDRGHRYKLRTEVAQKRSELTGTYQWPRNHPLYDHYELDAGWQDEETDTAKSEQLSTRLSRVTVQQSGWTRTYYLRYLEENFLVGTTTGKAQLLLPGVSWQRVRADNELYPMRGWKVKIDIGGADENLFSDASLVQLFSQVKWIFPVAEKLRVIARADFGTTWINQFSAMPVSLRFFAGGDYSIRGYDYQELGPKENDEVVGGKHLLVGSVELEYRFLERWSVAIFMDMGNALDEFNDPIKESAGLGMRWISPVGPVRLDIAQSLSDQELDPRVHIYMGLDF